MIGNGRNHDASADGTPSPSVRAQRLAVCRSCPELLRGNLILPSRCRLCGCFVVAKTAIGGQRCPAGKW